MPWKLNATHSTPLHLKMWVQILAWRVTFSKFRHLKHIRNCLRWPVFIQAKSTQSITKYITVFTAILRRWFALYTLHFASLCPFTSDIWHTCIVYHRVTESHSLKTINHVPTVLCWAMSSLCSSKNKHIALNKTMEIQCIVSLTCNAYIGQDHDHRGIAARCLCGAFSVRYSVMSWYVMFLLDSFVVTEHCWRRLQLVRYRLLSTCSLQTRLHPPPSLGATRFIGYRRNMLTRKNASPGARSRKHCHMCDKSWHNECLLLSMLTFENLINKIKFPP